MIFVSDIKREVARRFKLTPEQLDSASKLAEIAHPRQMAMSLALEATRHGASRVGDFFGRDHATVLHAKREVAKRIQKDLDARAAWLELRAKFIPEEAGADGAE